MKKNSPNSSALLQNADEQQLYQKLVIQITKDFVRANIPITILRELSHDALIAVLREKIYVLILEKFNEYLNLLYAMDIPEKAFKQIDGTDAVEVAEEVTFLVLQRELQKVEFKDKYTS